MKDLAPTIYRQRAVIEGYPNTAVTPEQIKDYLAKLSGVLDMVTVLAPITHRSDKFGEAGWIHWETSGAHFYAWEQPMLFFSVDIYTCKEFEISQAVDFTRDYFKTSALEFREF